MSPVPSHEALQYLPSGGCGHVHGGFLHLLSSAMISSLALQLKTDLITEPELNTIKGDLGKTNDVLCVFSIVLRGSFS